MLKILKQIFSFGLVGVINTIVDLGILNILLFTTGKGLHGGLMFTIFKTISFTAAAVNSYLLNKFWVFKDGNSKKNIRQFSAFLFVSLIGAFINITIATLVVTHITPFFISHELWPTFGALCGSFTAMTWNFLGYKYFVFQKNEKDCTLVKS